MPQHVPSWTSATTIEISSYMVLQSNWKMYNWQSEHEGDPAHFSRPVRDVLSNSYYDQWLGRGELEAWPPC
jgi:hypothetical protein